MQQQRFAGIDLHKKYMVVTTMDKEGKSIKTSKINNNEIDKIEKVLSQNGTITLAGVESTYGWYWLSDLVDKLPNVELKLGHAMGIKAITASHKKTDKIDSRILADLLRCNLYPESHKTTKTSRDLKEILRHRRDIVDHRSDIKRRIHSMLAKINLIFPHSDILTKIGKDWLKENVTQYPYSMEIDNYLRICESLNVEIEQLEKVLEEEGRDIEGLELMKTIPGISTISGLTILAEIDGIERFDNPKSLSAYAGLVPIVRSSGGKTHMGGIASGNKYIKNTLAESVYHTIQKDPFLKKKYEEIKQKKNASVAKVAIMRKLLVSIYHVLSKKEDYKVREIEESK